MTERLTGKVRFRTGWRGRLVLEVEVSRPVAVAPLFDKARERRETTWRDASVADLTKLDPGVTWGLQRQNGRPLPVEKLYER